MRAGSGGEAGAAERGGHAREQAGGAHQQGAFAFACVCPFKPCFVEGLSDGPRIALLVHL